MAEIRINSTGGLKLYDADDSHYAQIVAGTITSNVDAITLGHDTVTIADNLSLGSDSAIIKFGADSEITLTHSADAGLLLKHTATADDKPVSLTLQTGETDIAANDVIGAINFQAPDESTGTDAILVAAGIEAVSEGDFSSSNNATKLSFKTGASEAAAEKMSLSSAGLLTIADDLVIKDGGTIGVSSDADSITIASNGAVTFSQTPVFPDGSIAVADLDIDGATDIGEAIVDADLFIIDNGAGGTNRKTAASRLKTYIGAGLVQTGRTVISSDTAGIYLDDIFSTTYTNYIILIRNMTPASDEDDFRFRVNVSGTQKSTSEYIYMTEFLDTGGGAQGHESSASDTEIKLAHDVDNESWKGGYNAIMHVSTHLSDASNRAAFVMSGTASYVGDSGVGYVSHFGGTYADSDRAAVTGLDFYYNSGDIARGEITCYGVTIS